MQQMTVDLHDPGSILDAPLHELALVTLRQIGGAGQASRRNFVAGVMHVLNAPAMMNPSKALSPQAREAVEHALAEGWDYLERHGLVSREPLDTNGYFITRRGHDVLSGQLPLPTEPHLARPLKL